MAVRDIVVLGASAGGVTALMRLFGHLPADFATAIFVTLHIDGQRVSLDQILSRAGPLVAAFARDCGSFHHGKICLAVHAGELAIGIIMTGALYDGCAGLRAITHCGGLTSVQDPDEAEFPEMEAQRQRKHERCARPCGKRTGPRSRTERGALYC